MGDGDVVPARVQNVLDMEVVRLNLWSLQFNSSGVRLEGFVRSEDGNMMQKVHSGIICRRMSATMLFDVSGCFYELAGHIDREYQQKLGMPSRVIDEFMNGFPDNWAFLIKSCLPSEPKSALRPIQAAPEPMKARGEPIITMPDETVVDNQSAEKERKRKELQKKKEQEERLRVQREQREAIEAERKRLEEVEFQRRQKEEERRRQEEEDAANYTFRAPQSQSGDAITPIRFTRGNGQKGANVRSIFDKTPVRANPAGPLASSTPQTLPPKPRSIETKQPDEPLPPKTQPREPIRETHYCSDSEFAVPKLPAPRNNRNASSTSQPARLDFLDEMDALFECANVDHTPGRGRKARKPVSRSPSPNRFNSTARDRDRTGYDRYEPPSRQSNSQRYYDDYNMSRMSGRNNTMGGHDMRRDESRNSRKRGYNDSPENYSRRYDDRSRRQETYESDSRYDSKRSRPRDQSSSSGRSVRFEEDEPRNRRDVSRDSRNYRHYEDNRNRESLGDREDKRKLDAILRREKELVARLQNTQRSSSTLQRTVYSSDEDEMSDEWDRENQELLDNSMMFGDGLSKKKGKSGGYKTVKQPKTKAKPKPAPRPAQPKKNKKDLEYESDEMNDSIASNRPRRACATPSTPAPKRITWPKRDLDRLKHTIELKKPSGADSDWVEITRLLAKDGVDPEVVKQTAIAKLKWKEPTQKTIQQEEEEKKRRRGANARVKEGVRMHEELRGGNNRRESSQSGVEAVNDYEPDDVAADQSLLGLQTPIAVKKRGGTRASIMPQPVEDSPVVRGNNTTLNSPRLDQTKAKEVETTLKYVQHISMMNARPSSRANSSYMNKSSSRGGDKKNTSLSVEQGARKALKIINRGRTIQEEDEDEEDGDITVD